MKTISICITGPESTGKTEISRVLGAHFKAPVVKEYARDYLSQLEKEYELEDVLKIGEIQLASIEEAQAKKPPILFIDTDLSVINIWLSYKYDFISDGLNLKMKANAPSHYLLMDADLPWQPDPLRENPEERKILLGLYEDLLREYNFSYSLISGTGMQREQNAIRVVEEILEQNQTIAGPA